MADEVRREVQRSQSQAAAKASETEQSFQQFVQAIDRIAPEVAQACRELGIKPLHRSGLTKYWEFGTDVREPVGITPSGSWFFCGAEGKRKHAQVAARWAEKRGATPSFDQIRQAFKTQVALKAQGSGWAGIGPG